MNRGAYFEKEIGELASLVPGLDLSIRDTIMDLLIKHGEWGVALETLCGQIEDNELPITQDVFDRIVEVTTSMKMKDSIWLSIQDYII